MEGVREGASEFLGFEPIAVLGDMSNAFSDYVCDAGDAIEAALKKQPELVGHQREIEQGVNRWLMKMQRAGDSSFDRFESRALEESFHIPHDLQLVSGSDPVCEGSTDDDEAAELWAQLQQRVAEKRELKRKLASVCRIELAWEAQRASFEQLASLYRPADIEAVLDKARRLHETVRNGLGMAALPASNCTTDAVFASDGAVPFKALSHHREDISTVSVNDLQRLSTVLCT